MDKFNGLDLIVREVELGEGAEFEELDLWERKMIKI